jgi:hypothetical protein
MPTRTGGSSANSLQSEMGDRIRANATRKEEEARALLAEAEGLKAKASEQDKADDAKEAKRVKDLSKAIEKMPKTDEVNAVISRIISPDGSLNLIKSRKTWDSSGDFDNLPFEFTERAKAISTAGKKVLEQYFLDKPEPYKGDKLAPFQSASAYGFDLTKIKRGPIGELIKEIKTAPQEVKDAAKAYLGGLMVKYAQGIIDKDQQMPRGGAKRGNREHYSLMTQRDYHYNRWNILKNMLGEIEEGGSKTSGE